MEGLLEDLQNAPNASIVLLHACAHNPTGCDPTIDEWKQIISLISEKEHIAFFDSAYQGFASGDAEEDAQPFRYAVRQHVPILLAQSFAKNFGLYGERVGTLSGKFALLFGVVLVLYLFTFFHSSRLTSHLRRLRQWSVAMPTSVSASCPN